MSSCPNLGILPELFGEGRLLGCFCLVGVLFLSSSESIKIGVSGVEPGVLGESDLVIDDVSGV
jgi:hypothetical protein